MIQQKGHDFAGGGSIKGFFDFRSPGSRRKALPSFAFAKFFILLASMWGVASGLELSFTGNSNPGGYYPRDWAFINASCTGEAPIVAQLIWNGQNESFQTNSGPYFWSNKTGLAQGNYTFNATCVDGFGNLTQTPSRLMVLDSTPPSNLSYANGTANGTITASSIFVNLTFGESNPQGCTLIIDGTTNYTMDLSGSNCYYSLSDPSPGNHAYAVAVLDLAGNMAQSASVEVFMNICGALAGNLTLQANVSAIDPADNVCFILNSPNVMLDCAGFAIAGVSGSLETAVSMQASNTTLKNCIIDGAWEYDGVRVPDILGPNQTGIRIINNSFLIDPQFGDIDFDYNSPTQLNYTEIIGNTITSGIVISGDVMNGKISGNSISGTPQGTRTSRNPDGVIYQERGNGAGNSSYWEFANNNIISSHVYCVSWGNNMGSFQQINFINNTCIGGGDAHILSDGANFTIINSSFETEDWQLLESYGGYMARKWYLDVFVGNSSLAIQNARVVVTDANGTVVQTVLTDMIGKASFLLTQYVINEGVKTDLSPYSISVTAVNFSQTTVQVALDSSKSIAITPALITPAPVPALISSGSNVYPDPTVSAKNTKEEKSKALPSPAALTLPRKKIDNPESAPVANALTEKEALFDIIVQVLDKELAMRELPTAKISLIKFNKAGLLPVRMRYEIRDSNGVALKVEEEDYAVEVTEDFLKTLALPPNLNDGTYSFYAKVTYENGLIAEAQDSFQLGSSAKTSGIDNLLGYAPLAALILIGSLIAYDIKFRKPSSQKH